MDSYLRFAIKMAQSTGKLLLKGFRKTNGYHRGTVKEIHSLYDVLSDNIIKKHIERQYPRHSYLTEETGLTAKDPNYLWIIDPLDGTGNFVNANPFFSVSISLWINRQPYLGVIEAPFLKERFIAFNGASWVEDTLKKSKYPVHIAPTAEITSSYLLYCPGSEKVITPILNNLCHSYTHVKDLRMLGSAALELAWVGAGRADVYITPQICLWDIASGVQFVKNAGGKIMDFNLKEYGWEEIVNQDKMNIIASNGKVPLKAIEELHGND